MGDWPKITLSFSGFCLAYLHFLKFHSLKSYTLTLFVWFNLICPLIKAAIECGTWKIPHDDHTQLNTQLLKQFIVYYLVIFKYFLSCQLCPKPSLQSSMVATKYLKSNLIWAELFLSANFIPGSFHKNSTTAKCSLRRLSVRSMSLCWDYHIKLKWVIILTPHDLQPTFEHVGCSWFPVCRVTTTSLALLLSQVNLQCHLNAIKQSSS